MKEAALHLLYSVWRLIPANPILIRVVCGASRRSRHHWLRLGYLAALWLVVFVTLFMEVSRTERSLSDLAKAASRTFCGAATTQLVMMCFLAPAFTAGAIAQERDARTLNILLSTPMTNAQIVFGSLMSRLYFVIVLLLSGLPIFLVTMVWGGVTTFQVMESFLLAGATAVLTGAAAIFIAMLGVGTRRTIFNFYLVIALYLLSVYLLGRWSGTWLSESPPNIEGERMSWLTPLHPILALDASLHRVQAPPYEYLGGRMGFARFALAYPSAAYVAWTLAAALLLTLPSMFFVRQGASVGEPTIRNRLTDRFFRHRATGRTRPPRHVWANPVAWREAKTRASSGVVTRWVIIAAGAAAIVVLLVASAGDTLAPGQAAQWLAALTAIQFALALIVATTTAATAISKEKEAQSLELLLCTPLTSKYILWGKLRGLVSFAVPMLILPAVGLLIFGWRDAGGSGQPPTVWMEAAIELALLMTVFTACACLIGLKVSLTARTNVTAVMLSVGLLILLCAAVSGLGFALTGQVGGAFGAFLAPFTPFTSILYLANPLALFGGDVNAMAQSASDVRLTAFIGSCAACLIYAFIIWTAYTALVKNFDRIMREHLAR